MTISLFRCAWRAIAFSLFYLNYGFPSCETEEKVPVAVALAFEGTKGVSIRLGLSCLPTFLFIIRDEDPLLLLFVSERRQREWEAAIT